jgi:hypothetical protein
MKINCTFLFEYQDHKTAQRIMDALEVDNKKFISTELEGNKLTARTETDSIMSLLHTFEDYLSCLSTAENVIMQTKEILDKE